MRATSPSSCSPGNHAAGTISSINTHVIEGLSHMTRLSADLYQRIKCPYMQTYKVVLPALQSAVEYRWFFYWLRWCCIRRAALSGDDLPVVLFSLVPGRRDGPEPSERRKWCAEVSAVNKKLSGPRRTGALSSDKGM
jgi:hypothetical protein